MKVREITERRSSMPVVGDVVGVAVGDAVGTEGTEGEEEITSSQHGSWSQSRDGIIQ